MFKRKLKLAPPVLLIIGAHREELAFGELLTTDLDPERFVVLRIPAGISGIRPCDSELENFTHQHQQLYRQILNYLQPGQRLMVDIHQGINSRGAAVDVISADSALLDQVKQLPLINSASVQVRCIKLVKSTEYTQVKPHVDPTALLAKSFIPEAVWNHPDCRYIGIEVYLQDEQQPSADELAFSRQLIQQLSNLVIGSRPHEIG